MSHPRSEHGASMKAPLPNTPRRRMLHRTGEHAMRLVVSAFASASLGAALCLGAPGAAPTQSRPEEAARAKMAVAIPASPSSGTTRVRPDARGLKAEADDGDSSRILPDETGGYRIKGPDGGALRLRPDGKGGWRGTDEDGERVRIRPDGSSGYRIVSGDGTTVRLRPDAGGGLRGIDSRGFLVTIRPDGSGGFKIKR